MAGAELPCPGGAMTSTQELHDAGQSLWLDNITRDLLTSGQLQNYIDEYALTGLTSNPSIFDKAIEESRAYDREIAQALSRGQGAQDIFFELAIADLRVAADMFRPIHDRTAGVDGWVSLEVSPLLAEDSPATIQAAGRLHQRAGRPNLFIKIPGTANGVEAIEECIFAGLPINVTLLFSAAQYQAAAEAYLRGVERRIEAGLDPEVGSVASLFVSRWDKLVNAKVPDALRDRVGIAAAAQAYRAYRKLLDSARWQRLANQGARPQRLLWASTSTKDPSASDVLYVEALAAPFTINTMPEQTLLAFANHGQVGALMPADGGDADQVIVELAEAGLDFEMLASDLQRQGAEAFDESWRSLLACIGGKAAQMSGGD